MAAGWLRTDKTAPVRHGRARGRGAVAADLRAENCAMPIIWPAIRWPTCSWISTPYGAHTTASDALWMGVPVLTLSGRSFASRVCGSLVRSAGLTDLVLHTAPRTMSRARSRWPAIRRDRSLQDTGCGPTATPARCSTPACWSAAWKIFIASLCDAHGKGLTPQPDLTNLDAYFEAGIDHDHDSQEVLKIADYHGMYRAKLKRFHLARPLQRRQPLVAQRRYRRRRRALPSSRWRRTPKQGDAGALCRPCWS